MEEKERKIAEEEMKKLVKEILKKWRCKNKFGYRKSKKVYRTKFTLSFL